MPGECLHTHTGKPGCGAHACTLARRAPPHLKALTAAMRKATSLESTAWAAPSVSTTCTPCGWGWGWCKRGRCVSLGFPRALAGGTRRLHALDGVAWEVQVRAGGRDWVCSVCGSWVGGLPWVRTPAAACGQPSVHCPLSFAKRFKNAAKKHAAVLRTCAGEQGAPACTSALLTSTGAPMRAPELAASLNPFSMAP